MTSSRLMYLLPAALLCGLATRAHAQPACRPGTLAEFGALGSTGCTFHHVRISNVGPSWLGDPGSPPTPQPDFTKVLLTPVLRPTTASDGPVVEVALVFTFLEPFEAQATWASGPVLPTRMLSVGLNLETTSEATRFRRLDVAPLGAYRSANVPGTNIYTGAWASAVMTPGPSFSHQDLIGGVRCAWLYCMGLGAGSNFYGDVHELPTTARMHVYGAPEAAHDDILTDHGLFVAGLQQVEAVVLTHTPEPSTYALLGGGLVATLIATRRRRATPKA